MTRGRRTLTDLPISALRSNVARLLESDFRLALVAAHDDRDVLRIVYSFVAFASDSREELVVRVDRDHPTVPSISDLSFAGGRFEREMHDLFGVQPQGHDFLRPLVRHAHWPDDWHPMRHDVSTMPRFQEIGDAYSFGEVQGSGVYEIPVGPIHAGLIEPGHFRFSVVGETILKMSARLWFLHRGLEKLFEGATIENGLRIAERVSGDTTLAHALAYSLAVEEALGTEVPADAVRIRSILLELERIYNHVNDLGAMCNDVGFSVPYARALVIRESLLRLNESVTGHRLLRGAIAPGVTRIRRLPSDDELNQLRRDVDALVTLAGSNGVLIDRFVGTAVLSLADAQAIGALGPVARASGVACDAREEQPLHDNERSRSISRDLTGDVMARFNQRVVEIDDSLTRMHRTSPRVERFVLESPPSRGGPGSGLGIVEGWRGAVAHRVEVNEQDVLTRGRIVDPSFFNWPGLAIALKDTIVPDFPLVNKSFNLSYAGNDL